jgi:uncharacterized caspase-like protein
MLGRFLIGTATRWALVATLAVSVVLASGLARAEGRHALLIGNQTYANPALALRNPANDAGSLAVALDGLGFDTRVLVDADRDAMLAALDAFAEEAAGAEMALVFFAGHGVQLGGENHLLGADFSELALSELSHAAVTLSSTPRTPSSAAPTGERRSSSAWAAASRSARARRPACCRPCSRAGPTTRTSSS